MDILGNPVDVDPSVRLHVEAYSRLAALAVAVADGRAERNPAGAFVFDGLAGAGEALARDHIAPGIVASEADGTSYDFRLYDDLGHPLSVQGVLRDQMVARDALGLAIAPGVNGICGRLRIQDPDGEVSEAISTGSEHDWQRVS